MTNKAEKATKSAKPYHVSSWHIVLALVCCIIGVTSVGTLERASEASERATRIEERLINVDERLKRLETNLERSGAAVNAKVRKL